MDQVYAKIKAQRKRPFRTVVSGEKLFDSPVPTPDSCPEYDPNTLLDEGEWFKVSDFTNRPFCLPVLKGEMIAADHESLNKEEFEQISYLMAVQEGLFFFQRVRPSAMLKKKTLVFGELAVVEKPSRRIVINPEPDAVFDPIRNALLFRQLSTISPIFQGVDALYKSATTAQVTQFLENKFIDTALKESEVSKLNRKRIALALDTLASMSKQDQEGIFTYTAEYSTETLTFDRERSVFKIGSDEELKMLLYGIEQRYYTTQFGSEKRLANSVRKL